MSSIITQAEVAEVIDFFGRDAELDQMQRILLNPEQRMLLVRGMSGVGKTSLLAALRIRLRGERGLLLHVTITSQAQQPAEVVQQLALQLASSDSVQGASLHDYLKQLTKRPIKNFYRLGRALIGDVVKAKLAGAEGIVNEASSILSETDEAASPDAQAQILGEAAKDDLVLAFRELMQSIAGNGQRGVLLFDGLENASSSVVDTMLALITDLPDNWCIALTTNTERSGGVSAFTRVAEVLTYSGGEALELRGLNKEGLLAWMKHYNPAGRSDAQIEEALSVTQGRPFYLKRWLSGAEFEEIALTLGKRLAPAYQARFRALTPPAQDYLSRLCVLPVVPDDNSILLQVLQSGIEGFNLVAVTTELITAGFLEGTVSGSQAPHDEVRQQVLSILGPVKRSVAEQILSMVEALDPRTGLRDVERLKLQSFAGRVEQVRSNAPAVAGALLESSPEAADQAYEMSLESNVTSMAEAERAIILLNRARAKIGAGKYENAITFVDEADVEISSQDLMMQSYQVRLKALIRLNRYAQALTIAEHIFASISKDDPASSVETLRVLNTIYRDTSDKNNALATAKDIEFLEKANNFDVKSKSRIWRSLARTYSLFCTEKAVEAATKSLIFAKQSSSLRDIGNAHLAMGEAYRHTGDLEKSLAAYNEAIKPALALGNVDSLLWSTLGKADAEMLLRDNSSAKQSLDKLEPFFSEDGQRHPLEALHWKLSQFELKIASNNAVHSFPEELVRDYSQLGISWPSHYSAKLLKEGKVYPKPL